MFKLVISVFVVILISCGRTTETKNVDATALSIIPFDTTQMDIFPKMNKRTSLTNQELREIDSLLFECIGVYNKTPELPKSLHIDVVSRIYKKQIAPVINSRGEKEVWINCLCDDSGKAWKTELLFVDDGGSCYFNFKINLKQKRSYEFTVNGAG